MDSFSTSFLFWAPYLVAPSGYFLGTFYLCRQAEKINALKEPGGLIVLQSVIIGLSTVLAIQSVTGFLKLKLQYDHELRLKDKDIQIETLKEENKYPK